MRIPIRAKLTAALAVPMIALVGVAAYEAVDAAAVADAADAETELAVAALGPGSLVSQLQIERNWSGVDQIGMLEQIDLPVSSTDEARANTDATLRELEAYVANSGSDVGSAFAGGLTAMDDLAAIRADIDKSTTDKDLTNGPFANEVFDRYSTIIAVLLDDTSGIALAVDDAVLRTGIEIVDLATREYEGRANTVRHILLPLLTGTSGVPAQITVGEQIAVLEDMDDALLDRSVPPYAGIPEFAVEDPRTIREDELFGEFRDTGSVDILALAAEISSPADQGYLGLRTQAADLLRIEADAIVDEAQQQRQNVLALAAGAVVLAVLITWLASRSITRPLRSLTRQARAMADDRLPGAVQKVLDTPLGDDVVIPTLEPIVVRTRDEVADVAEVLTSVQERALDLAVEQAVLRRNIADSFVNLGRRNQNLVGRQLDFITELERDERDPETLESLFRLDHLATRMRRNAESLLRLAGGEPSAAWDGPVSLLDVVRGSLGEIEDYTRVEIRQMDGAALAPGVGADLAHALAELLENALTFSPPEDPVEVRGRRTPEGYVLAVIDNGVGMSVDELLQANRRLAGEESFTVAPSRYLGHYVAGHLTSRMGVRVQLQQSAAGGITARIDIPARVLVDDAFLTPPAAAREAGSEVVPAAALETLPRRTPVTAPEPPVPTPAAEDVPTWAPWPVPWGDDDAALPLDATEEATEDETEEPTEDETEEPTEDETEEPTEDATEEPTEAPSPPPDSRPDPVPGFGGLAPVATGGGDKDDTKTPSGLVRRVRGGQQPVPTPAFVNPMSTPDTASDGAVPATASSPDEVSAFLADFALGVDRGLTEAVEPRGRHGAKRSTNDTANGAGNGIGNGAGVG